MNSLLMQNANVIDEWYLEGKNKLEMYRLLEKELDRKLYQKSMDPPILSIANSF